MKSDAKRDSRKPNGERITSFETVDGNQRAPTSVWKDLFAGGVAGTAGIAIGHPFDTIKVRLQQQQIQVVRPERNSSTYRGLFQGIGAPLATAAVVNASVFSVYGATSRLWDEYHPDCVTMENSRLTNAVIRKHAVCGAVTGLTTSLVLSPIEYVKIRLQTMNLQLGVGSNSSFQLAKEIMNSHHGIQGLYRGLFATMLRQTPSLAVYFPVYHILKESIADYYSSRSSTRSTINEIDSLWWSSAIAGGLAGCLAWTIVYPIDAVKSRIQSLPLDAPAKERSFLFIAQSISRNEGFARLIFSRGLAVTLLRAFPVNGTIFFVYESVEQRLRPVNNHDWGSSYGPTGIETQLKAMPQRTLSVHVD